MYGEGGRGSGGGGGGGGLATLKSYSGYLFIVYYQLPNFSTWLKHALRNLDE